MQNSSVNPVSFGMNIKFVDRADFALQVSTFKKSVDWPWTAKQIVRAPQVYTRGVASCTAGGIITKNKGEDCFDVVMFHIDPLKKTNNNFEEIQATIMKKLGNSKPVQAFIFGCKSGMDFSVKMFDNIESLIKSFQVPYSKLKGSVFGGGYVNGAYDGYNNELSIFSIAAEKLDRNNGFNKEDISRIFDEIQVSQVDNISIGNFQGRKTDITDEELKYLLAQD